MKKIIIVNNNMHIGGVQKSLINLLKEISGKYDITLLLFAGAGDYLQEIPSNVKVIEGSKVLKLLGVSQRESKKIGLFYYLLRGCMALYTRLFGNGIILYLLTKLHPKMGGYDYAISFLHNADDKAFYGGCNEFVINCISAKQSIGFIHCDALRYSRIIRKNKKTYMRFHKIAACSEGCARNFREVLPEFAHKVYCVQNCQDYTNIISYSNMEPVVYEPQYFNIITVSRLGEEKGIDRAIEAIKRLMFTKSRVKLKYHIVGDGDCLNKLMEQVHLYKLDDYIHFYGNQKNPYRYMKNADLLLLPSYHEAAPMVFEEAKCLGLPILATKTTSTQEMIIDTGAGWVCENTTEGIENSLKYILENREEVIKVRDFLLKQIYDNTKAVNQFHTLVTESVVDG